MRGQWKPLSLLIGAAITPAAAQSHAALGMSNGGAQEAQVAGSYTPTASPLHPSQARALELLQTLRSYDLATTTKFVEQSFTPEALEKTRVSRRVWGMLAEERQIRGASFVRWESATATEAQLVYRNDLFDRLEMIGVKIERASPHRIISWTTPKALPSANPPPRSDQELAARLHAFAQRMADHDFFSGTVLITKGDQPIFAKAYGLAERNFKVPNRLDTKIRTASMNKMFTAVAIGQLVDQGRLSLEDPLSKYVPDAPGADRVRIKHLLSHTSGIGDLDLDTFWLANPTDFRSLDSWISAVEKKAPKTQPGTAFEYNNLGYNYLGKIIEQVSGEDYYGYLQNRVFKPAGMTNTTCPHFDAVVADMAYPYEMEFDLGAPSYVNMMLKDGARASAAGCAVTTVEDMARFARALRTGKLLRSQTFQEFTRVIPATGDSSWGLGFYTRKLASSGIDTIGHGGNSMGICTQFGMFDHEGIPWTFTILANSGLLACNPLVSETKKLLAARLTEVGESQ